MMRSSMKRMAMSSKARPNAVHHELAPRDVCVCSHSHLRGMHTYPPKNEKFEYETRCTIMSCVHARLPTNRARPWPAMWLIRPDETANLRFCDTSFGAYACFFLHVYLRRSEFFPLQIGMHASRDEMTGRLPDSSDSHIAIFWSSFIMAAQNLKPLMLIAGRIQVFTQL
jgi:hypothetical protein